MSWLITKYLLTALIVVLVSEIAQRSQKLGALITALPLVAVLTLIWLYVERQPSEHIARYAAYTFWYVLPTLPMFLVFPVLLGRVGFWPGLVLAIGLTIACFWSLAMVLRRFGILLF